MRAKPPYLHFGEVSARRLAATKAFLDVARGVEEQLFEPRHLGWLKARYQSRKCYDADGEMLRVENRNCNARHVRVPLPQADITLLSPNNVEHRADLSCERIEYMTGGASVQRQQVAFLNMIACKARRVDAIKTHPRVVSRNVKRGALIGALNKTSQNGADDCTEIHILTEQRTKSPQSGAQVIKVFTVADQVAVTLQRHTKAQDSGLGQAAAKSQILERQPGLLLVKGIKQLESPLDCFHSVKPRCWSRFNSRIFCTFTTDSSVFLKRRTCLFCHRKPMFDHAPIVLQTSPTRHPV